MITWNISDDGETVYSRWNKEIMQKTKFHRLSSFVYECESLQYMDLKMQAVQEPLVKSKTWWYVILQDLIEDNTQRSVELKHWHHVLSKNACQGACCERRQPINIVPSLLHPLKDSI